MTEKAIKVGVIDDEEEAINYISLLVAELPDYEIAFSNTDPKEGLTSVRSGKCDILLLDVMMPGLKGNVLAGLIKDYNIPVIFISGHDLSAKDAFEVKAVDFLTKPVSLMRLWDSLEKAKRAMIQETGSNKANSFYIEENREDLYLNIGVNSFQRISIYDIISIHGGSDYSEIMVGGLKHYDPRPLKVLETKLKDHGIIRIHKSYMINLKKASHFYPTKVKMSDGKEIPVGRTYRDNFMQIIKDKVW